MQTERIPVAVLRFAIPMDTSGLSVASSCSSRLSKKDSRFEITYLPWLRHHEIKFFPSGEDAPRISLVPDVHVKSWDPLQPVALPSAVAGAPEAARRK